MGLVPHPWRRSGEPMTEAPKLLAAGHRGERGEHEAVIDPALVVIVPEMEA